MIQLVGRRTASGGDEESSGGLVERGCRNGVRHSTRNRDYCGDKNDDPTASKEFDEVLDFHVPTFGLSRDVNNTNYGFTLCLFKTCQVEKLTCEGVFPLDIDATGKSVGAPPQ